MPIFLVIEKKKLDLGSSLFIYFGRDVGLAIMYDSVICMCFLYKFMVGYICRKLHCESYTDVLLEYGTLDERV